MSGVRGVLSPLPDIQALEPRWRALADGGAGSFFLGWTWIGAWLEATGARPDLLSVVDGRRDIALALVGHGQRSTKFGTVPALFLNEAGEAEADRAFIEYNGLLLAKDAPAGAAETAIATLKQRAGWRTLRIAGIVPNAPIVAAPGFYRRARIDRSPVYLVDLDAVRTAGGYLALLSGNTRSQIRRSFKEHGDPARHVERAEDMATADLWLAEMQRLNTGRHADNAWDRPVFRAFARALVAHGMADGAVALLRISLGDDVIGYLLNFIHGDRAMNYQSAFAEPAGSKSKPGLMSHAAAVDFHAAAGLSIYTFLAGKDRYKQSLSTGQEQLEWWWLERFSLRLEAEHWLRKIFKRPIAEEPAPETNV